MIPLAVAENEHPVLSLPPPDALTAPPARNALNIDSEITI
jgi:hypothetical protein